MALLEALRVLTSFDPANDLPPCDLAELADVLDAHGLGPLASYQLETRRLGARVPGWFRERLLPLYQGTINDNVFKLMTLKTVLRQVDVPAVLLDGAAYVDWLYPHLAFRPIGDLRLGVRGADGGRFAERLAAAGFDAVATGAGGHTATFGDGRIEIAIQEGVVRGQEDAGGLFDGTEPAPALGATVARPSPESALLGTVADLAELGLHAPLLAYVDLRELLALPELQDPARRERVLARAEALGLARAMYGACALAAFFFPGVEAAAAAVAPSLGPAERAAVDAVVDRARDPARLRALRGEQAAARAIVGARP